MSFGNEWLSEYAYELEQSEKYYELILIKIKKESLKNIWTTKTGKKIKIDKMSESHILNCVEMLKRNPSYLADLYIPIFLKELSRRYESAF